ncbi:MAG: SusE domain-containing protein [Alistipes sp.]|nr:SusE domain-containing protein [Alistipes sp.]
MKYLKYLSMFVAAAFAFASCETGIDEYRLAPQDELQPLTINEQGSIVVSADNMKEMVTFTCSQADFGQPVAVTYKFFLTKGDLEVALGDSSYPSISLEKSVVNGLVVNNLKVPAETTAEVSAYVVAYAGGSSICTPKSNVISFNVTTFESSLKYYHICGVLNGWDAGKALLFWEKEGGTNIFEGIYYFPEDATNTPGQSGFKILPNQAWDGGEMGHGNFAQVGPNIGSSSDGNLLIPAGIWQVTADIAAKTVAITAISEVALKGTMAESNWDQPVHLTHVIPDNVWRSEKAYEGGTEFKAFINGGWYGVDSADSPTPVEGSCYNYGGSETTMDIFTGHALQDGENIKVPADGSYYIKLYLDRTPWLVTFEKAE